LARCCAGAATPSSIGNKTSSYLTDFCSGKLKQRVLLRIFLPFILAAYFGSLIFAIWSFPGLFNWRTMSMSKLLYPSNNPQFHAIGSVGLAVAGLMTIPFAGYIGRRLTGYFAGTGGNRRSLIWRGRYQFDPRRVDCVGAFPPRNVRAGRGPRRRPGDAGLLLVRPERTVARRKRTVRPLAGLSRMEFDRAPGASGRGAAIAGCRALSMVELGLSGDRKAIVVAPGILGMDRLDSGVSVPTERRLASDGKRCATSY